MPKAPADASTDRESAAEVGEAATSAEATAPVVAEAQTLSFALLPALLCGGCGRGVHPDLDGAFPLSTSAISVPVTMQCKHDGCPSAGVAVSIELPVIVGHVI